MTTPSLDPVTPEPGFSGTVTEPVPTFHEGFAPVEPEPGPASDTRLAADTRPAARKSSSGSSRILNLALGAALLVAAAGVAFAVGRATAPASTGGSTAIVPGTGDQGGAIAPGNGGNLPGASFDLNGNGGEEGRGVPGDRGGFGGVAGGLTITGIVDSVSADAITIKLENGQTMTVGLDGSTTYHQQADAASSDVTAGKTVQLQLTGGFRPGQGGGTGTSTTLGTAGSVTIVP